MHIISEIDDDQSSISQISYYAISFLIMGKFLKHDQIYQMTQQNMIEFRQKKIKLMNRE